MKKKPIEFHLNNDQLKQNDLALNQRVLACKN